MDKNTALLRELMSSCSEAGKRYQTASGLTEDDVMKRLFDIFARQRLRFAEELRDCAPGSNVEAGGSSPRPVSGETSESENQIVDHCLESDVQTLALYREAVADTGLPARTRFLVSSQLALFELGHHRVKEITGSRREAPQEQGFQHEQEN